MTGLSFLFFALAVSLGISGRGDAAIGLLQDGDSAGMALLLKRAARFEKLLTLGFTQPGLAGSCTLDLANCGLEGEDCGGSKHSAQWCDP